MKYQRIWLASHVLYGSSRLGTKDYLPGQLYSLMDYEQAQPVIDSSVLNAKRPWYSAKYGDNIKPGATTAWGNTQTDPYGAADEAGSKQYELTNHLGNVQATVGDNRYAVADESTDTIKAFHPVIRSAYDYYPFGMLMPGRYVSDTSEHCVTISRPTWAWKEVTVACWDVYAWRWPGYTPINKGTAVVSGDAVEINAPAVGDGVSFDFPVTANVQQELDIDVERVSLNNKASVQIMELEGADWVTLAEAPINVVSGGMTIPFTPKANTVRIIWNGPILVWVRKHCISKLEWVEDDQLVTICDGDKDKYRFGYNGQEKVNEWAGIGNFNEFKERGQDSRIGRFLSVDPIARKYPWNSSYAFAENRVIDGIDLEGAEFMQKTGNFQLNTYRYSKIKPYTQQYVKGDIVVRNVQSHNIAVGLHIPDAALQNSHEYQPQVDYKEPEFFEVNEDLSLSSQQNQIKNFRGEGGANVALELLNFAEGASGWLYNVKNKATISYNYQSAQALGQAVNLVNTTVSGNMLPDKIGNVSNVWV